MPTESELSDPGAKSTCSGVGVGTGVGDGVGNGEGVGFGEGLATGDDPRVAIALQFGSPTEPPTAGSKHRWFLPERPVRKATAPSAVGARSRVEVPTFFVTMLIVARNPQSTSTRCVTTADIPISMPLSGAPKAGGSPARERPLTAMRKNAAEMAMVRAFNSDSPTGDVYVAVGDGTCGTWMDRRKTMLGTPAACAIWADSVASSRTASFAGHVRSGVVAPL